MAEEGRLEIRHCQELRGLAKVLEGSVSILKGWIKEIHTDQIHVENEHLSMIKCLLLFTSTTYSVKGTELGSSSSLLYGHARQVWLHLPYFKRNKNRIFLSSHLFLVLVLISKTKQPQQQYKAIQGPFSSPVNLG